MKKKWPILLSFVLLAAAIYLSIFIRERPKQAKASRPFFQISKIKQSTKYSIPCINIQVEGKQTEFEIDTGANVPVCLTEEILNGMNNKKFLGMGTSYGIRGSKYAEKYFELSGIKMGLAVADRLTGSEMNLDRRKDAIINPSQNNPRIFKSAVGWTFFNRINLYLDCKESVIAVSDSIETLQKNGYLVHCIEAPLNVDHFIELVAETEKGPLRCLLDTGCTTNFVNSAEKVSIDEAFRKPENEIEILSLKIGSFDFGRTSFIRVPIKIPLEYDAILGMEFIYSKPMFIDFGKKKIYLAVPTESTEKT